MTDHPVVTREEWLAARKALLAKEKDFTRARDELSRLRRELPWERIEKDYVFEGPDGSVTLGELFDGRSQLIVYHFMFDPAWDEGCKSCSLLSDHFDPAVVHLNQRDVSLAVVSHAPFEKLAVFKQRMGWRFTWVSSHGSDFNRDYRVSFTPEEIEQQAADYNYRIGAFPVSEAPGISVFLKDQAGDIFHTYSTYARGLDIFIGAYNLLDIVPKGRDEAELPFTMEWLRHHDRYGEA